MIIVIYIQKYTNWSSETQSRASSAREHGRERARARERGRERALARESTREHGRGTAQESAGESENSTVRFGAGVLRNGAERRERRSAGTEREAYVAENLSAVAI